MVLATTKKTCPLLRDEQASRGPLGEAMRIFMEFDIHLNRHARLLIQRIMWVILTIV
jgi:hypothetical protein